MKTELLSFQSFNLAIENNNNKKKCNSPVWHSDTKNTEQSLAPRETESHKSPVTKTFMEVCIIKF